MNRIVWRVSHVGQAMLLLAVLLFAFFFPWTLIFLPFFILPPPEKRILFEFFRNKASRPFLPTPISGRAPPF